MIGTEGAAPRVLVVTAGMGAGHSQIAGELARRLASRGACTEVLDVLAAAGGAGARLQRTYRVLLERAPWLYDTAMRMWARRPGPFETLTALGRGPFERALLEGVDRFGPDIVVSTYNLASQCLGGLVEQQRLDVPVSTFVTDPGAHPYWISAGVRHHFATGEHTAARLAHYGARGVDVVAPVLRPEFADPPSRALARQRLGLPADATVALINAGSWAVGGVAGTLRVLGRDRELMLVVLCGRDERLAGRLRGSYRVRAVPWTPDVIWHLAAADVVVDNAGGLTFQEARACGVPVVLFRPLPGHGRINAVALQRAGLAEHVRVASALLPVVRGAAARRASGDVPRPDNSTADLGERVLALAASPVPAAEG